MRYLLAYFNRLNIAQKLRFLGVSSAIIAGTIIITLTLVYKYFSMKEHIANEVKMFALIMAENISPAILANDLDKIGITLSSVEHNKYIHQTFALDPEGNILGAFHKGSDFYRKRELLAKVKINESLWSAGSYFSMVPVYLEGEHLGSLVIVASLDEFYVQSIREILVFLLIGLIAVGATFRFRSLLKESILTPIAKLDESTSEIIRTNNLLQEVPVYNNDEIGSLAQKFNLMLQHLHQYQVELEEQKSIFAHQAYHDALTQLPNRIYFNEQLQKAISKAKRHDETLALLFIDLDRFKQINDSFGHETGDHLLQHISQRLKHVIREEDTLARLGGDEFVIIMESLPNIQSASVMAQKIIDIMKNPVSVNEHELFIGCSIGISLYPQDGVYSEILLRNADSAMYRAKEQGRNMFQYYNRDMTDEAYKKVLLESALRFALEEHQFEPFFQPQVDVSSNRVTGMEALVRWKHPEKGLQFPVDFIPLASETGLIIGIDRQMLKMAMQQAVAWHRQGIEFGCIAVNVTMLQLQMNNFYNMFDTLLRETGCTASWIELEISEASIMQDPEHTIELMHQLRASGVSLAIDDFGTGYSSLSYLKRLPVHKLKIDRSFIQNIPENAEDAAIVKTIITLAESLQLEIIAEGVETVLQQAFLHETGCHHIQGYLHSKPVNARDATAFIQNRMEH